MYEIILILVLIFIISLVFYKKPTQKYIQFGKYKGSKWEEIPNNYLEWIINNHADNQIKKIVKDEISKRNQKENELKDDILLGIIESKRKCWKCKKDTKVIALKFYRDLKSNKEYSNPHVQHYIETLPLDIISIIQTKWPFYKSTLSRTTKKKYFANNCSHCTVLQGDYNLYEEIDSPFLEGNQMPCEHYILLSKSKNVILQ